MSLFNSIAAAYAKRQKYNRIKRELFALSVDDAHDLGFFREDAPKIAYRAVYG